MIHMSRTNLEKSVPTLRNRNLDLIKLISCIAVVVLHCLYTPNFENSRYLYQLCAYAVPCFFMASGWVLLNKRSVSWGYAFKKLWGIARIVVFWNIMLYGLQLVWLVCREGTDRVDILAYLRHYGPYVVKSVFQRGNLWQFWYLGAMGAIYFLLPVLHRTVCCGGRLTDCPRRGWILWGAFLLVSLTIQTVNMVTGRLVQGSLIQTFRLWTTFQYFLLGGLMPLIVGWVASRIPLKFHLALTAFLTVVTLAWRLLADHFFIHGVLVEYFYDDLPTIIWIVVGFSALMRVELKSWMHTFLDRCSPLIMGVYILHVPIRDLIRSKFEISGSVERTGCALVVCLISFLCAYIVRKLPFGKKLTEI